MRFCIVSKAPSRVRAARGPGWLPEAGHRFQQVDGGDAEIEQPQHEVRHLTLIGLRAGELFSGPAPRKHGHKVAPRADRCGPANPMGCESYPQKRAEKSKENVKSLAPSRITKAL